tara:strand:+ start:76069 stop:76656 length:588 start_codon:yes stop_codon:yes gene_type:complete
MPSLTLTPPLHVIVESSAKSQQSPEDRALEGHTDAWNELARSHNRKVVLTLLSRGLPPDVARDLAQDAWAKLIERQQQGQLQAIKMPGLAIKQALYLAGDLLRQPREVASESAEEPAGHDPHPRLWARERLNRAREVLRSCTANERTIFRAFYGSPGSSTREVGKQTGLSIQRIRQIHCELRKKLRLATGDEGGE